VLGIQHAALVAAESVTNRLICVELVLDPQGAGLQKGSEAARRNAEVGLEYPLELEQRLVIERDCCQVAYSDATLAETVVDGPFGKRIVAFLSSEPFLLRGGDDVAIAQQAGGAVVIEGGDAEYVLRRHEAGAECSADFMQEK